MFFVKYWGYSGSLFSVENGEIKEIGDNVNYVKFSQHSPISFVRYKDGSGKFLSSNGTLKQIIFKRAWENTFKRHDDNLNDGLCETDSQCVSHGHLLSKHPLLKTFPDEAQLEFRMKFLLRSKKIREKNKALLSSQKKSENPPMLLEPSQSSPRATHRFALPSNKNSNHSDIKRLKEARK